MAKSFLVRPPHTLEVPDDAPVTDDHAGGTPEGISPGYVLKKGEGPAHWFTGGLVTMKARRKDTDGQIGIMEFYGPRGWSAPGHVHDGVTEIFMMMDGVMECSVGDKVEKEMTAGDFLYVPQQTVHEWRVTSNDAKFLLMVLPGGFEQYFEELGAPAVMPTIPYTATHTPKPEDFARVRERLKVSAEEGLLKLPRGFPDNFGDFTPKDIDGPDGYKYGARRDVHARQRIDPQNYDPHMHSHGDHEHSHDHDHAGHHHHPHTK